MCHLKIVLIDSNPLLIKAWNKQLTSAQNCARSKFTSTLSIETHHGPLATLPIETNKRTAIVSPANSIGGMGGGFDEALCDLFTPQNTTNNTNNKCNPVESWIRKYLHHGYTPLGTAHVVEFFDFPNFKKSKAWNHLKANSMVVLPTMRVPHAIYKIDKDDSNNVIESKNRNVVSFVFDCIWETLCAVNRHNQRLMYENKQMMKHDDESIQGKVDTLVIPGLGTGYGNLPLDLVAKGMIGALSIWGLELHSGEKTYVDRGLLCLSFLGEEYTLFNNHDISNSHKRMFGPNDGIFDILNHDVGDFFKLIK